MADPMRQRSKGTETGNPTFNRRLIVVSEDAVAVVAERLDARPDRGGLALMNGTLDDRAAAILDKASTADQGVWRRIQATAPKATFFSYDYDRRTFAPLDDHRVRVRGAILGSYRVEIIPGFPGDMSFSVPAVLDVDVETGVITASVTQAEAAAAAAPSRSAAAVAASAG